MSANQAHGCLSRPLLHATQTGRALVAAGQLMGVSIAAMPRPDATADQVEFSHRKIPLHASSSEGATSMTAGETGYRYSATRVEPPPWTGLHRLGLTVLVVLAATALPAIVHLVAPGADPARIGLGIAGAEHVEVAGEGPPVAHTAVGDVHQPRPVASRQIGGARRPLASCDNSYCPALR
jgi:hypothetical protein